MMKTILTSTFLFFIAQSFAQTFTFPPVDTIRWGAAGTQFACINNLVNTSGTGYYVDVIRVQNDTAPGWYTYFCLDVCYSPSDDSARVYLLPNASQAFILDFFTSATPGMSSVSMKFKNVSNPTNTIYQTFYGYTSPAGVQNTYTQNLNVNIFPNPSSGIFTLQSEEETATVKIYNLLGEKLYEKSAISKNETLDLSSAEKGIYFVTVICGEKINTEKIVIE